MKELKNESFLVVAFFFSYFLVSILGAKGSRTAG